MQNATQTWSGYQARRHPVATFLALLILSPYLIAFAVAYIAVFVIVAAFSAVWKVRS